MTTKPHRFTLVLSHDQLAALDELVLLLPDVSDRSSAARRAIIEARDRYELLRAQRVAMNRTRADMDMSYELEPETEHV